MTKIYEGFPIAMFDRRVPSGKLTYLWKITIFNGIHYKSPFSIAMLIDRRVAPFFPQLPWLSAKVSEEPRLLRFPAPGSGWLRAAAREPLAALLREKDEVMVTWEWDGDVMGNFQSRIFG